MQAQESLLRSDNAAIQINRSKSAIIFEIIAGLIIAISSLLFGLFSFKEKNYKNDALTGIECDPDLLNWSRMTFYQSTIAAVCLIIVVPILMYLKSKTTKKFCYDFSITLIKIVVIISYLIFFVRLWVVYVESEGKCGVLSELVYFYIWFNAVAISVCILLFLLVSVCIFCQMRAMEKEENLREIEIQKREENNQ